MQIQVETDAPIERHKELSHYVESVVRNAVGHHADHLTHVEAHLGDANSAEKSGDKEMRCMLEARVAGVKNVAVTHQAPSLHLAIDGAADKLKHAVESSLGKLQDRQRRAASTGHLSADLDEQNPDSA